MSPSNKSENYQAPLNHFIIYSAQLWHKRCIVENVVKFDGESEPQSFNELNDLNSFSLLLLVFLTSLKLLLLTPMQLNFYQQRFKSIGDLKHTRAHVTKFASDKDH